MINRAKVALSQTYSRKLSVFHKINFLAAVLLHYNMTFWLQFRLLQAFRVLKSAGWGILLVLLVVSAALWVKALESWSLVSPGMAVLIAVAATGAVHLYRSDRSFMERGHLPVWQYLCVDYACIAVIFAIIPLLRFNIGAAVGSFAGLLWIGLPPGIWHSKRSQQMTWTPGFIPVAAYEWRMIVRSQWLGWIFAIVLVIATYFHEAFYLAGMFAGLLLIPQGFDYLEPFSMLPEDSKALLRRWRMNARVMYYWLLPAAAVLLIKNYHWAPVVVYVIVLYEFFLLLCTCYKYLAWAPGRRRSYNGTAMGVVTIMAAIPGGIIVVVGMALWYWGRVWKNR
jgi:hypothetical protein